MRASETLLQIVVLTCTDDSNVLTAAEDMDDALETILFFCDRSTLASAKAVTRRWARHARAQFRHPHWQARHLTLTELITEWRPRRSWP